MEILVLGGTQFVGRHTVEAALAAGHGVSTFTRGSRPVPGTTSLVGDRRAGELEALKDRHWDALIDVNGYLPREVRATSELLADQVNHCCFISTISVYEPSIQAIDENSPLARLEDPTTEEITGGSYGGLKVLCEQAIEAAFAGRCAVVRPHLVVGPLDPTDRFTYWPRRFAKGGKVLVPGQPQHPLQYVDARDLAQFVLKTVEDRLTGVYNGAARPVGWGELVAACQRASPVPSEAVWADEQWLLDQKVAPWSDLPAWIPSFAPVSGMSQVSSAKAEAAGFKMRSLLQTVQDTLTWDQTRSEPLKTGLSAEREAELLAQL